MGNGHRDRVTVDLRDLRSRLRQMAAAHGVSDAAFVRLALTSKLNDAPTMAVRTCRADPPCPDPRTIKVTLRLPAAHAVALATRARAAEVSQGRYVAGLIDGAPPAPLAADHAEAVAALVGSTDQLAALGPDLNALLRCAALPAAGPSHEVRAQVAALADQVRNHLAAVSPLVAALRHARRPASR
jgi:hypothetical protein